MTCRSMLLSNSILNDYFRYLTLEAAVVSERIHCILIRLLIVLAASLQNRFILSIKQKMKQK